MTGSAQVSYGGMETELFVLEDGCSVSRFIAKHSTYYELEFLEVLAELLPDGVLVVDVGAHIGNHSRFFLDVTGVSVLAVEPNPLALDVLRRNLKPYGSRASVAPVGVSDRDGAAVFAPVHADDQGTNKMVEFMDDSGGQIEVLRLDEVWARRASYGVVDGAIGLLKIDVEGHELQVLRGALDIIQRYEPIVATEVQSVSELAEIGEFMDTLGYSPVGTFNATPTVVWASGGGHGLAAPARRMMAFRATQRTVEVTVAVNDARARLARFTEPPPSREQTIHLSAGLLDELPVGRGRTVQLVDPLGDPKSVWDVACEVADIVEQAGSVSLRVVAELANDLESIVALVLKVVGAPYSLVFPPEFVFSVKLYELVNGASRRIVRSLELPEWTRSLIFHFEPTSSKDSLALAPAVQGPIEASVLPAPSGPTAAAKSSSVLRVGLATYYGPPCRSVAVNRLTYWSDRLVDVGADMGVVLDVELITASLGGEESARVLRLPDFGGDEHPLDTSREIRRQCDALGLESIGVHWGHALLSVAHRYDAMVLSGNPFHYFWAARDLAERGVRVLLDFRDPFSANPRLRLSAEQFDFLRRLESSFVQAATAVISVNETCLELIAESPQAARVVAANGFDERVYAGIPLQDMAATAQRKPRVVLAGRLYRTHDICSVLSAAAESGHQFVYVGPYDERIPAAPHRSVLGWRSPESLAETLRACDLGLVVTNGDPFESTTKVFDYIGADLEILVLTDGEPRTGELGAILDGLEGVYWCRNDPHAVATFFAEYSPQPVARENRLSFSRFESSRSLVACLNGEFHT